MKIYHVETQKAYNDLMIELEEKGVTWSGGSKPTSINNWQRMGLNTCISLNNKTIEYCDTSYYNHNYPYIEIFKYKAKGEEMKQEEMKQEEMKQNIFDWAKDVSVAVESFARDIKFEMKKSTVEADLLEAKSSAKKLIEKIDEYLESLKPEFNVGDYVIVDVNDRKIIAKIDALRENKKEAHGLWYDKTKVNVKQDYWFLAEGSKFRHARPTEIAEYESALSFHKHGRVPFEVKEGDIIRDDEGNILKDDEVKILSTFPKNLKKNRFTSGRYTFLKTTEEYNEWLGADDE